MTSKDEFDFTKMPNEEMKKINQEKTTTETNRTTKTLKETCGYACTICGKKFPKSSNRNRHRLNVHNKGPEPNTFRTETLKCPLCSESFATYSELDPHFTNIHDIPIKLTKEKFETMEQFKTWKLKIEKETNSYYTFWNSSKSYEAKITKFVCHRSGKQTKKSVEHIRKPKIKGSNKIGSNCPSRIILFEKRNGTITVHYTLSHVGHLLEVDRLRLTRIERETIADKLLKGAQNHKILQDIGSTFSPTKRISYTTTRDIYNIRKSLNMQSNTIFSTGDATSVNNLIEKLRNLNDNPILHYKPHKLIDPSVSDVENNDFYLIFMNSAQTELLRDYGNDILMIGSIRGNVTNIQLITAMVKDQNHEGFPVAFLWSFVQSEKIYQQFFKCIQEKVPNLKPKTFITDNTNNIFYNAFIQVFNHEPHRIICKLHLKKDLRENLIKITDTVKRKEIKLIADKLLKDIDLNTIEFRLQSVLPNILNDPITKSFGEYLQMDFVKLVEQWTHCQKLGLCVDTNTLEKWHQELKHKSLIGKRCQQSIDISIENVTKCLRVIILKRFGFLSVDQISSKLSELLKRHKTSDVMINTKVIQDIPNSKWLVADSANGSEYYNVTLIQNECKCSLVCNICSACLHMYSCNCLDYTIQYNMCKHIHLICKRFGNNDLSAESGNDDHSDDYLSICEPVADKLESEKQLFQEKLNALSVLVANTNDRELILFVSKGIDSLLNGFNALQNANLEK